MSGTRLLAITLGVWLVFRAVSKDASGRTLVDRLLGRSSSQSPYLNASVSSPSTPGSGSATPSGLTGNLTSMVNEIAGRMGWNSQQVSDWLNVIQAEDASGSLTATNPSSGAYGIAQFISGAGEYAQYGGNSTSLAGQLTAMANYIKQRYGDPSGAWAHEQANHWY